MTVNTLRVRKALVDLSHRALDTEPLTNDDFKEICQACLVEKMYYDMDVGVNRYVDPDTKQLIVSENIIDGKIILFDSGKKTDLVMKYTYFYNDIEYVHAYIEFCPGVKKSDLDLPMYQFMADQIFLLISRQNLRAMLDFREFYDDSTSIPNMRYLKNAYAYVTRKIPGTELCFLFINLQNFKYLNEVAGVKGGDAAMIKYAAALHAFMGENECACRVGGDNYAMFVKKENFEKAIAFLDDVKLEGLPHLQGHDYSLSAWVGVSPPEDGETPIDLRIEHASVACTMGKVRLKRKLVFYNGELAHEFTRVREVVAMFYPAAKNHEFHPFFQPKVNMLTGELIGFEALCRWIHEGKFIYPDQFIPVLDKQSLYTIWI
ncbi:MAG: diguanylate cyclase [Firmicutes bacterium]|nr:diguanylate cyclase [Bacillota bacterium]